MHRRTLLKGAAASFLAAPAIAQPAKTATLRFVPQANLTLLDPHFTTATVTGNHAYYVFDTLYSVGADGKAKPQMAESHTVSDNGRVWRIKLRDGLKFHDGTPVRAIDCALSLERWSKREPFGQILDKSVEKWGTADDKTVEIRLTKPFPLLLEAIGKPDSSCAFIMPERLAKTDPNKQVTEMVGSGPYRFIASEYNTGSKVVYEKFDGYVPRNEPSAWATGGKVVHYPRIEWNIISDPGTAGAALQNGEIDWWEQPLPDLLPLLAKDKNITLQTDIPQGRISIMRFNQLQAPFNNVKVRRAVMMAVNQEDYMRGVFGDDKSMWKVCRSLFPCDTAYETKETGDWLKGNLDGARAALKESGYNGETVVIINPTDFPAIHPLGLVTADMLTKIGMKVDLRESDWGTVVQRRASRESVEKGGWSIFHTFGSAPAYATPATSSIVRGQGATGWFGWWANAKAEELAQTWLDAPDDASRGAAAAELGKLALTDVATVPLGQWYGKTAFRKTITGVLPGVSPYPWGVRPA